ncbi:hypothetical protein E4K10_35670 [Streptomyces sp. T1317-0309]|nr:hypothetical protein E4K10_35670 [Streptomyces sp. T1317-0309]
MDTGDGPCVRVGPVPTVTLAGAGGMTDSVRTGLGGALCCSGAGAGAWAETVGKGSGRPEAASVCAPEKAILSAWST